MAGGGLDSSRGWGVVAAAFAAMFAAFGIAYGYGALLEEMRADFGIGRAAGATFFSLTALLYFGLGGITGGAGDRFGQRRVLLVGAVALGVGLVVTSRAASPGIALAAYGLGVGIGVACAYVPMMALVGAWFERRRTFALGVAVACWWSRSRCRSPSSSRANAAPRRPTRWLVVTCSSGTDRLTSRGRGLALAGSVLGQPHGLRIERGDDGWRASQRAERSASRSKDPANRQHGSTSVTGTGADDNPSAGTRRRAEHEAPGRLSG